MVHLPIARCAFQRNTPHPHRGPQKHPLPEVTAWIRWWSRRLAGTWWMKPVLGKLLLQSPRAVIQTLSCPLLVCCLITRQNCLGRKLTQFTSGGLSDGVGSVVCGAPCCSSMCDWAVNVVGDTAGGSTDGLSWSERLVKRWWLSMWWSSPTAPHTFAPHWSQHSWTW